MHSCIYEGHVAHQRRQPVDHKFRYGLNMVYVDLDELPQLIRDGIVSDRKLSLAALLPEDHLALSADEDGITNKHCTSLRYRIWNVVQRETGESVRGPVRLLTQLRYFGYYFSPLNLYYCFDEADDRLQAIVAEVSNTPWREQHLYVLHAGNRAKNVNAFTHAKTFHVSPFMDIGLHYRWGISTPGQQLQVSLSNCSEGAKTSFLDAELRLARRPLSRASMTRMLVRYPFMTAQILGAIYFQAFRLWWKACPYYPHPKTRSTLPQPQTAN